MVNINLKKKPDWFLEKTWGTVSVVRYKGEYIMESLVNSDFVDEVWKNNLSKIQVQDCSYLAGAILCSSS